MLTIKSTGKVLENRFAALYKDAANLGYKLLLSRSPFLKIALDQCRVVVDTCSFRLEDRLLLDTKFFLTTEDAI